jgi:hypothetical protein
MASSTLGNVRDVLRQAGLYGKHGLKSSPVPATPQCSFFGYTRAGDTRRRVMFSRAYNS